MKKKFSAPKLVSESSLAELTQMFLQVSGGDTVDLRVELQSRFPADDSVGGFLIFGTEFSMTGAIQTNDPELEAALRRWLEESRMPLPAHLALTIDVAESLPCLEDHRVIYRQGFVEIQAGAPQGWVQVRWPGHAVARIDSIGPAAEVVLTRESTQRPDLLFRGFLLVVLIFLWKRESRFHVHGGTARDPQGRGWMLIGNTHAGKSTTIALLARRGWEIGTDDAVFLEDRAGRVAALGFRDRIALRSGGLDLLGCRGGQPVARRDKTSFTVEELGGTWVQVVEPDVLLFAERTGERTILTPAQPREILRHLIQNSPWAMFEATAATEHLDVLSRLGRQARCYRATLGPDIFEHPHALMGMLP